MWTIYVYSTVLTIFFDLTLFCQTVVTVRNIEFNRINGINEFGPI
jgi:hypothetical protein